VDDNRDAADSLSVLLARLGAELRVAYDGSAALAALDEFHPAVMLLDLGMPGLSGYDVAKAVRVRPELSDVALVALTGWGQDHDRQKTAAAGFAHHLVKPVDLQQLQTLLSSIGMVQPDPV
jgi:CheY-like chemotaxis protein